MLGVSVSTCTGSQSSPVPFFREKETGNRKRETFVRTRALRGPAFFRKRARVGFTIFTNTYRAGARQGRPCLAVRTAKQFLCVIFCRVLPRCSLEAHSCQHSTANAVAGSFLPESVLPEPLTWKGPLSSVNAENNELFLAELLDAPEIPLVN